MRVATRNAPEKKEGEEHKCPRCDKDITLEEIKKTCTIKNNKGNNVCLIEDDKMIKAALPYLNQYRKKVGINTCVRKAHFLAQIAQESKFSDLEEGFNYYWEALINTFGAFQTEEGRKKAKLWGRAVKSKSDNGYASVSAVNQENIANWVYKNKNKNGDFNSGDGSIYRGRGFKQITWKSNYEALSEYFNKNMKLANEPNLNWVKNPLNLSKNPKDAIVSALAYWGFRNINQKAVAISDSSVENVTYLINPTKKGLSERIRFFNNAVKVLETSKCPLLSKTKDNNRTDKGSIVVVSGTSSTYGSKESSSGNKKWLLYKVYVYCNLTYNNYKTLKDSQKLPNTDYITYLTRDAHMKSSGRSTKRYGTSNETPSGKYFLNKGGGSQKFHMYLSDEEGISSASIQGVNGWRGGIAIHGGWSIGSLGCLTTHTSNYGNRTKAQSINPLVQELIDNVPDFNNNSDDKPVILILEERNATKTETIWTGDES